jgi:sec-independent protein translocase protein TatA
LAIEGFEAIAILAVLAIVFLWGPQKLPEMARSIGEAKREFDKASKGLSTLTDPTSMIKSQINAQLNPQTSTSTAAPAQTTQPVQDPIIVAAKSLGITTEGRTKEELAKEIVTRTGNVGMTASGKETAAPPPPK